MTFIINILLFSVSVFVIARFLPAVHLKNYGTAIWVAIVYSLVNFFVGWLLRFISMPFIFLSFGLFTFVVNAVLLWITDKILDDFKIDSLGMTLLAAFLITVLDYILKYLVFGAV